MARKTLTIALITAILSIGGLAAPAAASDTGSHAKPDNGRIAFGRLDPALDNFSLWVADADGSDQRRVTEGPANFSDWSPDGTRIAFDFPDDHGVHIALLRLTAPTFAS